MAKGDSCCTGADALGSVRTTKSDIGKAVRPPAAPGPESKGSVAPIRQVGEKK
jgi:hypothetical protein